MNIRTASAVSFLFLACSSAVGIEVLEDAPEVEAMSAHVLHTGVSGTYLIRFAASLASPDAYLRPHERIRANVSSAVGDEEEVYLGPAECSIGDAVYDCHRFTISVRDAADTESLRRDLAQVGAYLIANQICSAGGDCWGGTSLVSVVVRDAAQLNRAMRRAAALPGVARVERSVNGRPQALASASQRLVAYLLASDTGVPVDGDLELAIGRDVPTEVTLEAGGHVMNANVYSNSGGH